MGGLQLGFLSTHRPPPWFITSTLSAGHCTWGGSASAKTSVVQERTAEPRRMAAMRMRRAYIGSSGDIIFDFRQGSTCSTLFHAEPWIIGTSWRRSPTRTITP